MSAPDDMELHGEILKKVLAEVMNVEMSTPPPVVTEKIHSIIKKMTGNIDPYKSVKDKFNNEALKLYPLLQQYVKESDNPFRTVVKLAVAGNIIDFGHRPTTDDLHLLDSVNEILEQDMFLDNIEILKQEISKATKILYLGDNAGEIVFDKLFIEFIMPANIIFAVRKDPIINDVTLEDAQFVGLTDIVKVIDNGAGVPGTYLPYCSQELKSHFESADLIISKGQGNYETLNAEKGNIFFLLRAKCGCIAKEIGCELNDIVVMGSKYAKISV
jgi:hypothetical protein